MYTFRTVDIYKHPPDAWMVMNESVFYYHMGSIYTYKETVL